MKNRKMQEKMETELTKIYLCCNIELWKLNFQKERRIRYE